MTNFNSPTGYPLFQSRNGGKIHFQHCGQRSIYAGPVKGTETMTREEIVAKYGTDLCRYCFPEIDEIAPVAPVVEAPAADEYCTGSGTRDWANGTSHPERWGRRSNGGKCGHCGEWAGTASQYNPSIRKHKAK
jgi:hypothetical protein